MPPVVDFNLYLITDRRQLVAGDLLTTIKGALDAGVRAVQLREKDLGSDQLLKLAEALRVLTHSYQARLLINRRIDVALAVDADGVQLSATTPELVSARQRLGANKLLGVSTHNLAEIASAEQNHADFVTFGPVYPTPSKLPYGDPVGLAKLEQACRTTSLPVFALGGVTQQRLAELLPTGITGVALIGGIIAAVDPRQAASSLLAGLRPLTSR